MNKFEEFEAFVAVVDQHSFSGAADRLGVAKSILSRRVSDLEKRLGVQLMQRTTRKLSLTDAGRHFYQRVINLLSDLNDAEQMVSDAQCSLSGKIKLTAPLGIGIGQLSRPISEFMKLHADVEIALELDDRNVDLVGEGYDLAVRIGQYKTRALLHVNSPRYILLPARALNTWKDMVSPNTRLNYRRIRFCITVMRRLASNGFIINQASALRRV